MPKAIWLNLCYLSLMGLLPLDFVLEPFSMLVVLLVLLPSSFLFPLILEVAVDDRIEESLDPLLEWYSPIWHLLIPIHRAIKRHSVGLLHLLRRYHY